VENRGKNSRPILTVFFFVFLERLGKLIIFPIPRAALSVFYAIRWAFNSHVTDRIVLIPGPAERNSPLPKEYLREYIDSDALDLAEEARLGNFAPVGTTPIK